MSLTAAEDADLRRLTSFDRINFLDMRGQTRLQELRLRDRRATVRPVDEPIEHLTVLHVGARRQPRLRCSIYPT
jgi:hypothetical protein